MIECRSPEQIRDDLLIELHTELQRDLSLMCAGRCLYLGDARNARKALMVRIERAILGEEPMTEQQAARAALALR